MLAQNAQVTSVRQKRKVHERRRREAEEVVGCAGFEPATN
ncbi:quinolinate synthetase [Idiomarina baltica OS145]|uniref:Quinolinate synthetase n=1 Tax=Idiomarina baltica OS145 TaxID=314276 RepID=A0ABM9WJ15_9GAMM|nr:quinolinate synthetase [Idiomarina baltica OS145]